MIVQELQQLGFSQQDAETAVTSCAQPSLATCLDWLCLHIPEEELPTAFAPGMLIGGGGGGGGGERGTETGLKRMAPHYVLVADILWSSLHFLFLC